MLICTTILLPFYLILFIVTQVIQQIVTTVCNWISSILTTVIAVLNQVCNSLPWPLSLVCNWVTTFVTVVQTVWNYICNTIIQTIINIITQIIVILIWLVRLICFYVTFPLNLPNLILCRLGIKFPKYIKVCIKILTDNNGNPAVTLPQAMQHIAWANDIYKNCELQLVVCGVEFIQNNDCINNAPCSPSAFFKKCFAWFTQHACLCCSAQTIYFVNSIQGGASGCSFIAGGNFIIVDNSPANDGALAQELGHNAGLGHSNDPDNFMCGGNTTCNPSATKITKFQCCMLRRIGSAVRECI